MPEAVVNYLTLLGWHPKDDKEFLTFEEIVKEFEINRIQKGGAIFNEEKLSWFNHQYLMRLTDQNFLDLASPFMPEWLSGGSTLNKRLASILKEKISSFGDITNIFSVSGELGFINELPQYPNDMLFWKKDPSVANTKTHLEKSLDILVRLEKEVGEYGFTADAVKVALWSYAETAGKGNVLWPLRVALTGQERSPDPFISAFLLGPEETKERLNNAISKLK